MVDSLTKSAGRLWHNTAPIKRMSAAGRHLRHLSGRAGGQQLVVPLIACALAALLFATDATTSGNPWQQAGGLSNAPAVKQARRGPTMGTGEEAAYTAQARPSEIASARAGSGPEADRAQSQRNDRSEPSASAPSATPSPADGSGGDRVVASTAAGGTPTTPSPVAQPAPTERPASAPSQANPAPSSAAAVPTPIPTKAPQQVAQAQPSQPNRAAPSSRSDRAASTWQDDFIASAAEAARVAETATGVPASVTVAQAILESNWGRATIGGNNYFGIKAETKPGPAGVVWAATKEYTAKGWITIKAPFRAYENMAQSFIDHGKFFVENSRYSEALRNADDPKLFAKLIQKAGYATDPVYAQSLISLMDKYNLYRFDQSADTAAPAGG